MIWGEPDLAAVPKLAVAILRYQFFGVSFHA